MPDLSGSLRRSESAPSFAATAIELHPRPPSALSASRNFRFALLFMLAMTEMLPVALLGTAMPMLLRRSGASMQQMGVLSLIMFPWALKALWAPLVDKLGARSKLGRYRSWLFITHPMLLITLLLGAFMDVPSLLTTHRGIGIPALLWLSLVSATADTASHGLAVNLLSADERGVGNGVQNAGMMIGRVVGGGLMVMLVGRFGWHVAMLVMAALVVLPLVGIVLYQEPPVDARCAITPREALAFFGRPRIGRWLAVLVVISAIPNIAAVPFQTVFIDHGLDLTEIGLVIGIVGCTAGAISSMLGGLAVARLGRERAFYVLNLVGVACLVISTVLLTRAAPSRFMLYVAIIFDTGGMALRGTMLCVLMMDHSRGHVASTDYTVQYSLQQFCGVLVMGAGGFLAGRFGATPLLVLAPLLTLCAVAISSRVVDRRDFQPTPATNQ